MHGTGLRLPIVVALLLNAALLCFAGMPPSRAAEANVIPSGAAQQTAVINGVQLQLFTYRPDGCAITGMLLVFHGLGRNVAGYRNDAIPIARRLCLLVVAPLFGEQRFPTWRYQRGGIIDGGQLQPAQAWTVNVVPALVDWVRAQEKRSDLPYDLIGHSAGAQFLSRVAAYVPLSATRIVIANPSTWVLPSLDTPAPYGFGGVYPPVEAEDALRRYLAAPITVLLGEEDVGSKNLADSEEAKAQGATRLVRGQNTFRAAQAVAQAHGWPFNWRLALVPDVGHTARGMLGSEQAFDALRP